MAKFKIGDRVRAIKEGYGNDYIIGKVGTIIAYPSHWDAWIGVEFDDNIKGHACSNKGKPGYCWYCKADTLVPVVEQKIVITTDGVKKTTATLYDGKQVAITAVAKCCPSDEFDFETGAKLAFERLFSKEDSFDWEAFSAGKIEKRVNRENIDDFLKECDAHNLNWRVGEKASKWNPFEKADMILKQSSRFNEVLRAPIVGAVSLPENIYIKCNDGRLLFSEESMRSEEQIPSEEDSFDWEAFKNHAIAVEVTAENCEAFLTEAEANGCKWRDGRLPTEFKPSFNGIETRYVYGFEWDHEGEFGIGTKEPSRLSIFKW